MKTVAGVMVAVMFAGAGAEAAGPPRCRVRPGLYEERLALAKPNPQPAAPPSNGAGGASSTSSSSVSRLNAVFEEYYGFFDALGSASRDVEPTAVTACCAEIGEDRLASLACQLVSYLAGGRKTSAAFIEAFPAAKNEVSVLADLDAMSTAALQHGSEVPSAFLPKGPSFRFVDELFLLVLDGKEDAIAKYFTLAASSNGDMGRYIDQKLALMFRESPGAMVTNWFVLRKHRQKLKAVAQAMQEAATPQEQQRVINSIRAFCTKDDPDCQEILKLVSARR